MLDAQTQKKADLSNGKEALSTSSAPPTQDPFSIEYAKEFTSTIQAGVGELDTKQTNKVTEFILDSAINAVQTVVQKQNFPKNSPVELSGSADKKTAWLEESGRKIKISPPHGSPLDLQILRDDDETLLLNMESELHGNRQRNEDFKKLVDHAPLAEANSFVYRDKSAKKLDKTINDLIKKTSGTDGDVVITSLLCKNNDKFKNSMPTTVVARDGRKVWDSRDS